MGRGFLYLLTMTGVLVTIGLVVEVICLFFGIDLAQQDFWTLFLIAAVMGFAGSIISLFNSKSLCIKQMNVRVIDNPTDQTSAWLVKTISLLAQKKGVKMPQVGIYQADEMNAFATGWNKDAALVAVSSGLLERMSQEEVEAVLGHEMSHVRNGDMVTMTLLQGAVSTVAILASFIISSMMRNKNGRQSATSTFFIRQVCTAVFGFLGNIVVMAFSRWREYRADAGSAEVLGKQAMIEALQALKAQVVQPKPDGLNALCISGVGSLSELFMTHPTLDKRIAALQKLPN